LSQTIKQYLSREESVPFERVWRAVHLLEQRKVYGEEGNLPFWGNLRSYHDEVWTTPLSVSIRKYATDPYAVSEESQNTCNYLDTICSEGKDK